MFLDTGDTGLQRSENEACVAAFELRSATALQHCTCVCTSACYTPSFYLFAHASPSASVACSTHLSATFFLQPLVQFWQLLASRM